MDRARAWELSGGGRETLLMTLTLMLTLIGGQPHRLGALAGAGRRRNDEGAVGMDGARVTGGRVSGSKETFSPVFNSLSPQTCFSTELTGF